MGASASCVAVPKNTPPTAPLPTTPCPDAQTPPTPVAPATLPVFVPTTAAALPFAVPATPAPVPDPLPVIPAPFVAVPVTSSALPDATLEFRIVLLDPAFVASTSMFVDASAGDDATSAPPTPAAAAPPRSPKSRRRDIKADDSSTFPERLRSCLVRRRGRSARSLCTSSRSSAISPASRSTSDSSDVTARAFD